MKRVLQVVNDLDGGGVEKILSTFTDSNPQLLDIEFLKHNSRIGILEKSNFKNFNIFYASKKNIFKYIITVKKILKNKYTHIHVHQNEQSWHVLLISLIFSPSTKRILHNHTNKLEINYLKQISIFFCRILSQKKIACSYAAGETLFAKSNFSVIYNSIDFDEFKFNISKRKYLRVKYEIQDKDICIGNIARFELQKNHDFIIELVESLKKYTLNFKVILIGDGSLKKSFLKKVEKMKIENFFLFISPTQAISQYYSFFDVFILPSFYEGLGVVCLEAQINGLSCLTSKFVPSEVICNENAYQLKLDSRLWAEKIIELDKLKSNIVQRSLFSNTILKKFSHQKFIDGFNSIYE